MTTARDFTGKIVLVTGSSSGIGEEIAIQFAKYGAKVIVTGRGEDKIAAVVEKCNQVSPKKLKALGVKCDVGNDSDVRALVDKVISTYGGLDILVNNAGIFAMTLISDPNVMTSFDSIIRTNLRSPFYLTHLLVPHLIKSKGNIINISSVNGLHPYDVSMVYCASKAALDMFTKCLAIDLGPKGVRVNSVNPAAVKTPIFMTLGLPKETLMAMEKQCIDEYPLGRIGEVDDVAKFVLFLASDDASFITGLVGQIDGGSLQTMSGVTPKQPQ
jgi:NAD(P)-dependent dehydrogenase (short-subunit alcohol dehydrogenase family)